MIVLIHVVANMIQVISAHGIRKGKVSDKVDEKTLSNKRSSKLFKVLLQQNNPINNFKDTHK